MRHCTCESGQRQQSSAGRGRTDDAGEPCNSCLQAGGSGSTGDGRVLDVCPEKVHQRVPLFVGSKKEVEYLEKCFE